MYIYLQTLVSFARKPMSEIVKIPAPAILKKEKQPSKRKRKEKEPKEKEEKQKQADTSIIKQAKRTVKRIKKTTKQRQQRVTDGIGDDESATVNYDMSDIIKCIEINHEVAKGKAFLTRMQNTILNEKISSVEAFLHVTKRISNSRQLLNALKTNPAFTEKIVARLCTELESTMGAMLEMEKTIKNCEAYNAQLRTWNIALEKRCKMSEENLLKKIHQYQNAGFTNVIMSHQIFANSNPVNAFVGPSYKKYISRIQPTVVATVKKT